REGGVVEDEPGGSRRVIGGGPREGKVPGGNDSPTSRRGTDCRVCDEPADVVSRVVTFGRIGDDHLDAAADDRGRIRSEEHTSELQSLTKLACRLLIGK